MAYKTHRAIRHSSRVSSEHGCAIEALIGKPGLSRYRVAKEEIAAVLRRLTPAERRRIITELAKEEMGR